MVISAELGTGVGLPERPVRRGNVVGHNSTAITSGDLKGERLPVEVAVALPILPPVP